MSLEDLAYDSVMTDKEKVVYLESEVARLEKQIQGLSRALALENYNRLEEADGLKDADFTSQDTKLEAFSFFSHSGEGYSKCTVNKHKDSEFIYINFLPIDGPSLSICMTEKSYEKFMNAINKFKEKVTK
jgi:hypothetical protein